MSDKLIAEARESYATDRCTLDQFEQLVDRVLAGDFPIPFELGWATIPAAVASHWSYVDWLYAMRGVDA